MIQARYKNVERKEFEFDAGLESCHAAGKITVIYYIIAVQVSALLEG